jgi:hypothetical protein
MASYSSIEWTEATWNPVTGCSKISPGCTHCYAERMAARLKAMGNPRYHNGFRVTLHHDFIDLPARWRKSRLVFVNSMSDLFHEQVPGDPQATIHPATEARGSIDSVDTDDSVYSYFTLRHIQQKSLLPGFYSDRLLVRWRAQGLSFLQTKR